MFRFTFFSSGKSKGFSLSLFSYLIERINKMDMHTEFSKEVLKLIKSIPRGKVLTYGDIARQAGHPQGARGVGWLLHSCTKSHNLPWQRVIKSGGKLSFPTGSHLYMRQKELLEKEGIIIFQGRVDLEKYSWKDENRN